MIGRILICIVIIGSLFSACAPIITFNQPQPSWVPNKKEFPLAYQGLFLSSVDSSKLTITPQLVEYKYKERNTIAKNAIDTIEGISRKNGLIYGVDKIYGHPIPYVDKGKDSIQYFLLNTDTLFKIARKNFLRQYKGAYYMNKQLYRRDWKVTRLNLNKQGQLVLSEISEKNDLPKLLADNKVEEVKGDSSNILIYRIKLNRHEFKQFIKNNGFSNAKAFNRVNQ